MVTALEKEIGKPLKLQGDWVVTSDWHIPYHDKGLVEAMCQAAKKYKIQNLLIAGDFFNQDAFSQFTNIVTEKFEDECNVVEDVIDQLKLFFKEIKLLCGNHDYRILRVLADQLRFPRLMRLVDLDGVVEASRYPHCTINNKWYVLHPDKARKVPGSRAREEATIQHKNIILAHGHLMSLSFDSSGKFYCVDSGGMVDRKQIEYIQLGSKAYPVWQSGFIILRNDYPRLVPARETGDL